MSARTLVYPTRDELLIRRNRGLSTADRLSASYVIDPTGCWRWTRACATNGYGHISMQSVYYQAHLLVYILEVGPLPEGLEPDHLCRNRWCVNPADIEFVTHAVNIQRGARTVLSAEQVAEIRLARAGGLSFRALGRRYGVDHAQIHRIVHGTSWRPEPVPQEVAA